MPPFAARAFSLLARMALLAVLVLPPVALSGCISPQTAAAIREASSRLAQAKANAEAPGALPEAITALKATQAELAELKSKGASERIQWGLDLAGGLMKLGVGLGVGALVPGLGPVLGTVGGMLGNLTGGKKA